MKEEPPREAEKISACAAAAGSKTVDFAAAEAVLEIDQVESSMALHSRGGNSVELAGIASECCWKYFEGRQVVQHH